MAESKTPPPSPSVEEEPKRVVVDAQRIDSSELIKAITTVAFDLLIAFAKAKTTPNMWETLAGLKSDSELMEDFPTHLERLIVCIRSTRNRA